MHGAAGVRAVHADLARLGAVELVVTHLVERPLAPRAQPALRVAAAQVLMEVLLPVEAARRLQFQVDGRVVRRRVGRDDAAAAAAAAATARGRQRRERGGHDREDEAHRRALVGVVGRGRADLVVEVEVVDRLAVVELVLRDAQRVHLERRQVRRHALPPARPGAKEERRQQRPVRRLAPLLEARRDRLAPLAPKRRRVHQVEALRARVAVDAGADAAEGAVRRLEQLGLQDAHQALRLGVHHELQHARLLERHVVAQRHAQRRRRCARRLGPTLLTAGLATLARASYVASTLAAHLAAALAA